MRHLGESVDFRGSVEHFRANSRVNKTGFVRQAGKKFEEAAGIAPFRRRNVFEAKIKPATLRPQAGRASFL